jgi:hypothetical protein
MAGFALFCPLSLRAQRILGLNGLAVYLMAQGYRYVWLFLLLLAAIGLSFLMERVLPYEEIWNQAHDDTSKDVAHGVVYEIANLITLFVFILISSTILPEWSLWPQSLPIVVQFLLAILIVDCTMTVIHYWGHRVGSCGGCIPCITACIAFTGSTLCSAPAAPGARHHGRSLRRAFTRPVMSKATLVVGDEVMRMATEGE